MAGELEGQGDRLLDATYEAERHHFWFRGLARFSDPLISRALAGRSEPTILDCGFGTGANMARLAARGRTFGFDITRAGVRHARRYGETRLAQASITAIPFADATFDLVTAFDVFACLDTPDIAVALEEIHRVLKPNGALFFNTAALPILRGSHSVFGSEVHRARRRPMRRLLEAQGFTVERLSYTNFSLLPVMFAVRLTQRLSGLPTPEESGVDIAVPPAWVNAPLAALLTLESKALRVVDMPLGSSLIGLAVKR